MSIISAKRPFPLPSGSIDINGELKEFSVFDTTFEGTETLTRSTQNYVNGINNDNWIYGNASAPFDATDFVDNNNQEITYWTREFSSRKTKAV